jgi:predicted O-methyltransferase YrrM
MKNFTKNWNQEFIKNTKDISNLNLCLEIGSFEGLTSKYICENLLSERGKLICIDPLTDNYLNDNLSNDDKLNNGNEFSYFNGQYDRFMNNVGEYVENGKIELIRDLSSNSYKNLIKKFSSKFDLIYIDGDHRPDSVYLDGINCFELCKNNGYILFDDYLWKDTGKGIDRFLEEKNGQYELLINDYQILIKKIQI